MADLSLLYREYGIEKTIKILNSALALAEIDQNISWYQLQNKLRICALESYVVADWLADNYKSVPRISNHWIRCAKLYVVNNQKSSLVEMTERLKVGNRTAFQIMLILEQKKYIKILSDFTFERIKNGTDMAGFERQIRKFSKKYRGRCEPELLERLLYVDYDTAFVLAVYGREKLGLKWRGKWKTRK